MPPKSWHSLPEYQALRALMQGGTTTAAAHQLGLSQSAISRSIASLEARSGPYYLNALQAACAPPQRPCA